MYVRVIIQPFSNHFKGWWSGKEEGKKMCNVSWLTISLPKSASGLGIGSLRDKTKLCSSNGY
jgi:hypothetical protein